MDELKNRSLRLSVENYRWLAGLPGRTMNDAITGLRENYGVKGDDTGGAGDSNAVLDEILELVRSLPDLEGVKEAVMEGIREFRAQAPKKVELPASGRPEEIPGVVRGVGNLPRRESALERLARERREREMAARSRSSIGDDPSFSVDPEFVQE